MLRFKLLAVLVLLSVLDFSPFPVVGLVCIWIVLIKPRWFYRMVRSLYGDPLPPPTTSRTEDYGSSVSVPGGACVGGGAISTWLRPDCLAR